MPELTVKQGAEHVRKRLRAAQAARLVPACLRFRVRATRGGKINIEVEGHRDLIAPDGGDLDNEEAKRWEASDGKQLLEVIDGLARDIFKPRPEGETKFGMLILSVTAGPVRTIRMD